MNPYEVNPRAIANGKKEDPADKSGVGPDSALMAPKKDNPDQVEKKGIASPDDKKIIKKDEKDLNITDLMNEISWSEQDVLQSYLPFSNNPDPIVRQKGLKIYREMMQDDQVKVAMDLRIQARLSTEWEIVPGDEDDPLAVEMADFIKFVLQRTDGNFESDLEQIFSAIGYGFSLSELIFDYIESGEFTGKIGLKAIKTREPFNYDFKIDGHGNLLGIVYIGVTGRDDSNDLGGGMIIPRGNDILSQMMPMTRTVKKSDKGNNGVLGSLENPFPPEKFIIYSYNMAFGNLYGRSDFVGAFKWWLMKKHASKFWAIWLERYASPFVWAQYKRDAGLKPEALNAIDDFLRNLSSRQGVRVSDAVELFPMQFTPTAGNAYELAIEAFNRYIAHAILVPNLLGFTGGQGSSGGSYSLGQKQFDSFVWVLEKMGRDISDTVVGEQIIKRLIKINYGDIDSRLYPKFKFVSIDNSSIDIRSQIIQRLAQQGFVDVNEAWVRDFLSLPKKDPEVVLQKPEAFDPFNPGAGAEKKDEKGNPVPEKGKEVEENPEEEKGKEKGGEKKSQVPDDKGKGSGNGDEDKSGKAEDKKPAFKFKERSPDYFERKMKVNKFKADLESVDEALFNDASEAIEEMRDELIDKVLKKNIVLNGEAKAIQILNPSAKSLKEVLEKWLVKIFLDSKLNQLEEMGRAGLEVEIIRKFEDSETPMESWNPLPPKEAIDYFSRKVTAKIINSEGKRVIIDLTTGVDITFFQQRAFTIAGIVRDDILNDAKQVLLNGIKRQDQTGAVKDLKDLFNRYLEQGVEVDGDLLKPSRLNTIVRTNVTEAVNEGRASMMTDPEVGDFVQFFEYTAIMDSRTTEYCACMDGKVFRIEDLDGLKPPAHYNCRSFTVPVTQFEVDDLKASGRGVEVSSPCADRATGFSDLKRSLIPVIPAEIADVVDPKKSDSETREERLRRSIEGVVTRCPYKLCNSQNIKFSVVIRNVVEFECADCSLPFRVSQAGDLYLYDAGAEKWDRATQGLNPQYFSEKKKKIYGGEGSGNWNHEGRPGLVGGSGDGGGSLDGGDGGGDKEGGGKDVKSGKWKNISTAKIHKVGGDWTPERKKLHTSIVEKSFKGKSPVASPVTVMLGGGTASGKSTLVRNGKVGNLSNVIHIDSDQIKEMIPEYSQGIKNKDMGIAARVHEESSHIAKLVTDKAVKGKYNILLDGTGKDDLKLRKNVEKMRASGHKVVGVYASVPVRTAIERNFSRAKDTGRYVPELVLREIHRDSSRVSIGAVNEGLFDEASFFDTQESEPRLMARAKGKELTVHNEKLWRDYVAKGEVK